MLNLIDYTNFKFPFLPEIGTPTFLQKLNEIIELSQEDFLLQILGDYEYNKFEVDLNGTITPTAQKWIDFLDGKTYQNSNDKLCIYKGIKKPLMLFCFFSATRYNSSLATIIGESSIVLENSNPSRPNFKVIDSYNRMSNIVGNSYKNRINSFYSFFTNFPTDYPDWTFSEFGKINSFGI